MTASIVPTGEAALSYGQSLFNWLNPFGNFWDPPEPNDLYFTLQCAFAPAAAAAMAETPQYIKSIDVLFANGVGSSTSAFDFRECKSQDHGGEDYYPVLDGSQVRLGCTPQFPSWDSVSNFASWTHDFECSVGVEIDLGADKSIRTYQHVPANQTGPFGNSTGEARAPSSWNTSSYPQCNTVGFYEGGVVPPDWPAGDVPEWADVTGCNGLTVFSDDLTAEFIETGDQLPMTVGPVDPDRPPGGVDVVIDVVEARPGGTPVRWQGSARWPASPGFTFVVGPDTDQADWVFRLTCSDGTSKTVYYDPTGEGGNRRTDSVDLSFGLDECLADAPELGLDPSSWVPGLVARLKCLLQWATSTSKPMEYRIGQLQSATEDSGFGDVVLVATAPYRTMDALADGASPQTTITTGFGVITLPAVDSLTADRIRLLLSVLMGLYAVRASVRMWSRAANTRVVDEE